MTEPLRQVELDDLEDAVISVATVLDDEELPETTFEDETMVAVFNNADVLPSSIELDLDAAGKDVEVNDRGGNEGRVDRDLVSGTLLCLDLLRLPSAFEVEDSDDFEFFDGSFAKLEESHDE